MAEGYGFVFNFFVPNYEHPWNFIQVALILFCPKSDQTFHPFLSGSERRLSFSIIAIGVGTLIIGNSHDSDLHWAKPEGEVAFIVFSHDAQESFKGAIDCAMDHHGMFFLAIRC